MGFISDLIGTVAPIAGSVFGGPLGGIAGGLIGKAIGGGGTDPGFVTTGTQSAQQQALMQALGDWFSKRVGAGREAFPGGVDIPVSPLERQGMGIAARYARSPTTGVGEAAELGPTYDPMNQAIIEALKGISPEVSEERFRAGTLPAAQRMFEETTMPTLRESFIGPGTFASTGRQEAETEAAQRFGETMSTQLIDAIERGRYAGLSALPAAGEAARMPLAAEQVGLERGRFEEGLMPARAEAAMGAGAYGRAIQERNLLREMTEYARTSPEDAPIIQQLLQFLGMGTTATAYQPGAPSPYIKAFSEAAPAIGDWFKKRQATATA